MRAVKLRKAMADVQVTCITRQPADNPHEGVTHLGNANAKWTRQQFIRWIDDGEHTFYMLVNGGRREIGIVNGPDGKYLRTHTGGDWNDHLLSLPECP